jgi:maspardin
MPAMILRMKISRFFDFDRVTDDMMTFTTEYQVETIDTLPQRQLASRLSLLCCEKTINRSNIGVPDEHITLIDTFDGSIYPKVMQARLHEMYPDSRRAILKTGGTAPYLSRSDEFNIYLLVHLRNVCGQNLPVYDDSTTQSREETADNEEVLIKWNQ